MGLLEKIDFHVHTNRSKCAEPILSLERVVKEYEKRGYKYIGLTDHYYPEEGIRLFEETRREIDQLKTSLKVYLSAEIEVSNDRGELDCEELSDMKSILDYISAGPHFRSVLNKIPSKEDPIEYFQRMLIALTSNKSIDVILHPWDPYKIETLVNNLQDLPRGYLREFAKTAAKNGKIVEISNCMSHYWMRSKEFTESYKLLVRELLKAETKIVIGSDGHNINLVSNQVHLSVQPTLCDTQWATEVIRAEGGTDANIGLPRIVKFEQRNINSA